MKVNGGFTRTDPSPLNAVPATPGPLGGAAAQSDQDIQGQDGPGTPGGPGGQGLLDRNEMQLAGIIGEQLAEPLNTIDQVVKDFVRTKHITRSHIQSLRDCIDDARQIAMQAQQLARLAGGRLRQSHERLSLDAIVNEALAERASTFHRRGLELHRKIKPVDIIVDPGLLSSLVGTAIDWVIGSGAQRLSVSLEIKNWPEHGLLVLKADQAVAVGEGASSDAGPDGDTPDTVSWYLLAQIAQTMGLTLNRLRAQGEVTLVLEFARTVKQLEGLSAVEVDMGGDSSMYGDSKPMAGHRVLLVTTDEAVRGHVKSSCRNMGLVLDTVQSSAAAVRFCELDKPHLIVIDERLRDAAFNELRDDLLRYDANLPFIEIANADDTLEMASWVSGSMTRVGRGNLPGHLPSILVFELAKVM